MHNFTHLSIKEQAELAIGKLTFIWQLEKDERGLEPHEHILLQGANQDLDKLMRNAEVKKLVEKELGKHGSPILWTPG